MKTERNVIESITSQSLTKEDLLEMLEINFPLEEVGTTGRIAQIVTTKMTDGTINQTVLFGKILND